MTQQLVKEIIKDAIQVKQQVVDSPELLSLVVKAGDILKQCVDQKGTIYTCGNGGSTCDAMHLTEELVARYKRTRPGIRSMHLMDSSIMTCWSNDLSFEDVFARQIETFGRKGDVLVALSTSGNSKNVIAALQMAKQKDVYSIALTGKGGGKISTMADLSLIVPSQETERIQELHITFIHIFCEILDRHLCEAL